VRRWISTAVGACILAAVAGAPALADGDEARVRGTCTGSTRAELRVRDDGGRLRVELELRTRVPATRWDVVVVRERRLAWRGTIRTPARGSARVRRELADWYGTDTIAVRARSGRGETCRATATV
jgi:hypothetical protein